MTGFDDATSFEDLVAAATVGVARRPLRICALEEPAAGQAGVLDDRDQAAALLDAAALLSAGRRAGRRPARGVTCPAPAADDGARELSARAGRLLGQVAVADADTLGDLLAAAGNAGYRAPAPLLPMLLDAAARSKALRPAIGAVLGPRGRWLAAQRPDWQPMAADPIAPAPSGDNTHDLAAADEETLEAALDHKREAVRVAARRELARRPDSAFSRRAVERAAAALRRGDRGAVLLVATPPARLDDAMARDGIPARPVGAGVTAEAWLLTQVIAAAPLDCWETMIGLYPAIIVAMRVAGDHVAVHTGWRLAAIRQRNATWAWAMLGGGVPADARTGPGRVEDYQLVAVLPPDDRAERAARLLEAAAPFPVTTTTHASARAATASAVAEVCACPGPWPDVLAGAVLSALLRAVTVAPRSQLPRELVVCAARKLPADGPRDHAAELRRLADLGTCPAPWAAMLRRTAETIALRRAFYEEIR